MARRGKNVVTTGSLLAVCLMLMAGTPLWAEDPPKEDPKSEQQPTPAPGSLAAAASKIKLQKPTEGEGGAVVITDGNVKKTGAGAAVSQGTGATAPAQVPALGSAGTAPTATSNANQLAEQLMAQKAKVDNMEAQIASYDEQLAAPPADPHYAERRNSPQNRAPGVVDPAQGKRDAYAAELEKERAVLRDLEKRARAGGVRIDKGEPKK